MTLDPPKVFGLGFDLYPEPIFVVFTNAMKRIVFLSVVGANLHKYCTVLSLASLDT